MCIMCVEIFKGRMTIQEGRKALRELVATTEDGDQLTHYRELAALNDEEFEQKVAESSEE